mmetsp:Transcript_5866/g.15120  ORF Transcript_5866/g.15120 Transcript_5866/m.15120 type:complete len:237 (+) Transcript_5866:337-1047(+)
MSSPRAATSVATSSGRLPSLKCFSAASRSHCSLSPWMAPALRKPLRVSSRLRSSQRRFVPAKTMARSVVPHSWRMSSTRRSIFASSRMNSIVCSTLGLHTSFWLESPMNSCAWPGDVNFRAMACTALGHVALNMSVCRSPTGGHSPRIVLIDGSNPMSSMRSASSSTTYFALCTRMSGSRPFLGKRKSSRRPGVATTTSAPCAMARICSIFGAPPNSTTTLAFAAPVNLTTSSPIC